MHELLSYIQKWAQPEALQLMHHLEHHQQQINHLYLGHEQVITVPIFDEPEDWWHTLVHPLKKNDTLWVWIFNCPENCDSKTKQANHQNLQRTLRQLSHTLSCPPFYLGQLGTAQQQGRDSVLIIDRVSQAIPQRCGVGLARKIAADCAVVLHLKGLVKSHWIFNTDADAALPENYLTHGSVSQCLQQAQTSALQMGFVHEATHPQWAEATWCYDQYLRYHFRGLLHAQSPYAYTTIGSLLAVSMKHYTKVRGFPKRPAAEDFYLLNKLAKIGQVKTLDTPVVKLQGRPSHRVPFGTGPSLRQWAAKTRQELKALAPAGYDALKQLLKAVHEQLVKAPFVDATGFEQIPANDLDILRALGFFQWLPNSPAHSHPDPQVRTRAFDDWFDALKTWQFVKSIAKNYPEINLEQAPGYFLQ